MNEITWDPHEDISLEEKIQRTKNAIRTYEAYTGSIAQAMVVNKKKLLAELEKQLRKGTP